MSPPLSVGIAFPWITLKGNAGDPQRCSHPTFSKHVELFDSTILIFRVVSARSQEITVKEFITLFQPKDGRNRNKGTLSCPNRLRAAKLIQNLPDNVPNWKMMFFYVFGIG